MFKIFQEKESEYPFSHYKQTRLNPIHPVSWMIVGGVCFWSFLICKPLNRKKIQKAFKWN